MRLTKNELRFIRLATQLHDGVYDWGNNSDRQFKENYGLTKKEAAKMLPILRTKVKEELYKRATVTASKL